MLVRERQEVQEVPRRLTRRAPFGRTERARVLPSPPWPKRRAAVEQQLEEIRAQLAWVVITFDPDALTARRTELEARMGEPGFWDDQERAAADLDRALARRRASSSGYEQLTRDYDDARELYSMDGGWRPRSPASIAALRAELERLQEEALFSGEYDAGDAVVTLQSDVGGTDAQDFTEMLLRMYQRWADDRGFSTEVIEASPGEEAGLKSATFTVEGDNAYGILRAERGKHRLVRLSPFDQAHRRHTSFAQVIPAPLSRKTATSRSTRTTSASTPIARRAPAAST